MIILAFDSTARAASVAVCDNERLLGLYNIDNGLTQSELLLPMAEHLLSSLKLKFSDVELLCTATGPGSFTGVRIGTALVKGIAFGRDIPCVSVSTLEELCENITPLPAILVPCMDARRGQLYTAIFKSDGQAATRLTPDVAMSIEDLAKELKKYEDERIYLAGDGYEVAKEGLARHGVQTMETPQLLITENAYSCAMVALRKYRSGDYLSDTDICATYLRLPQAERERLEREKTLNEGK
jgi:tRNA threonylcarbamoyladenosine biosynthesis protein TsaB